MLSGARTVLFAACALRGASYFSEELPRRRCAAHVGRAREAAAAAAAAAAALAQDSEEAEAAAASPGAGAGWSAEGPAVAELRRRRFVACEAASRRAAVAACEAEQADVAARRRGVRRRYVRWARRKCRLAAARAEAARDAARAIADGSLNADAQRVPSSLVNGSEATYSEAPASVGGTPAKGGADRQRPALQGAASLVKEAANVSVGLLGRAAQWLLRKDAAARAGAAEGALQRAPAGESPAVRFDKAGSSGCARGEEAPEEGAHAARAGLDAATYL